jgi:phosphatidylcholine synthase
MKVRAVVGYLIHFYTASSMVWNLVAAYCLFGGQLELALLFMLVPIAIDATDGMLARRFKIWERVPGIDGRRLDDVVDYCTYVFMPALFMLQADMLLQPELLFAALPLLASAFGFSQVDAKLDDEGFFLGFPSYWNVIILYFYLFGSPAWLNTLLIVLLSVMVFVPTRYIYPTKFKKFKLWNMSGAWMSGFALITALFVEGPARDILLYISLIYPVYYTVYSFMLDWKARNSAR